MDVDDDVEVLIEDPLHRGIDNRKYSAGMRSAWPRRNIG